MGGEADRAIDAAGQRRRGDPPGAVPGIRLDLADIDPSQVKLNWQPVVRSEPWKTTPQTLFG